jgi:hypothetical protein
LPGGFEVSAGNESPEQIARRNRRGVEVGGAREGGAGLSGGGDVGARRRLRAGSRSGLRARHGRTAERSGEEQRRRQDHPQRQADARPEPSSLAPRLPPLHAIIGCQESTPLATAARRLVASKFEIPAASRVPHPSRLRSRLRACQTASLRR